MPVAGGEVTPLVERPGVDSGPVYSPDGRWIAFTSHGGREVLGSAVQALGRSRSTRRWMPRPLTLEIFSDYV